MTTESFGRTLVQGKDDFGYFPGEIVNTSNSNMKEFICCFHTLQWFVVVSTLSVFVIGHNEIIILHIYINNLFMIGFCLLENCFE